MENGPTQPHTQLWRPIQFHDSITDEQLTDKQKSIYRLRVDKRQSADSYHSVLVYPSGVR